ncbi:OLC1v1024780C1 [Oldenlandia corymbosa var. corymbosa]|uniref:OLC1v1024780C1 n=1 Tax=Oldenlandia corymbosa var. corymbosa TaxID=529605 RepID=A0AAV1C5D7_OLDCO|nr:OLC1v1024780C1 [Oldenlandia corymbosa var. corymbosa]
MANSSTPPPNNQEMEDDDQQVEETVEAGEQVEEISNVDEEEEEEEEEMEPEEQQDAAEEIMPDWVNSLLRRKFFGVCLYHAVHQKNELNKYCITCDAEACRYCLSSGFHDEHEVLKIYRHVYQDVVPFDEMDDHFDCERVQPYKCNKKWVVSLHPLPHCGSGAQYEAEASCDTCQRKLGDPEQYRFCCISCKEQGRETSIFIAESTYSGLDDGHKKED